MDPSLTNLTVLISMLILTIYPLYVHTSSPPSEIPLQIHNSLSHASKPASRTSQPSEVDGGPSHTSKSSGKTSKPLEVHGETKRNHPNHHRRSPHPSFHRHKAKLPHLLHSLQPQQPKSNLGKKAGMLFLAVGISLQVVVVGFLGFKKWQIMKMTDSFGELRA